MLQFPHVCIHPCCDSREGFQKNECKYTQLSLSWAAICGGCMWLGWVIYFVGVVFDQEIFIFVGFSLLVCLFVLVVCVWIWCVVGIMWKILWGVQLSWRGLLGSFVCDACVCLLYVEAFSFGKQKTMWCLCWMLTFFGLLDRWISLLKTQITKFPWPNGEMHSWKIDV